MIERFKDISSENPIGQVWKLLRSFLDIPSVSEKIRQIHQVPERKHAANIKKQAEQIGYCIRQAEEYFKASSQVGLPTRPTLLYYGGVSLSRALVLLRKKGDYSIDALRKKNEHNHHGLDLDRGLAENVRRAEGPEAFFGSLQCKIHVKSRKESIPWGHFPLFYESLVPCAFWVPIESHEIGSRAIERTTRSSACANLLPLESLIHTHFNTMEILKILPDMFFVLLDSEIEPGLCRGDLKLRITHYPKIDESGNKQIAKIKEQYMFSLDGIFSDTKTHLLDYYRQKNPSIDVRGESQYGLGLSLTLDYSPSDQPHTFYIPDIVDDINGKKFYIFNPDTYLSEPATHLALLFCLGMLSRYYPDIWMKVIDENVKIAELTDSLLNIIYRKFPNLILDQLTGCKHYIHL
jgi:hypothetical protein